MDILRNNEIIKALEEGYIIYMKDSSIEKRYYRINNKILQYTDDNVVWIDSNLSIDELLKHEFMKV